MKQLSLFDTSMNQESLPTPEELEQSIKFLKSRQWFPSVERRFKYLGETNQIQNQFAVYAEFVVHEVQAAKD